MRKNYKVLFFCIIITISVSIITWNVRSSAPGIYQESTSSKRTISSSLYIAVVTSGSLINSRGNTINSTWGQMTSDIEYYVGEGQENNSKLPAIGLKGTDDGYPPQKKVYAMYQYLYDNYIDKYDWFMRADDDVYVKVPKLKKYLSNLDPSQPLYIGSPGKGRKQDLKRLKLLPTDTYCMGGPGVVLSRALLQKLGPHLKECLDNVVVSYNEDVEVGRCIIRRLDIQCTNSKHVRGLFFQDYSNGSLFDDNGKLRNKLNLRERAILKKVLTFHPLKSKEKMYSIHQYYTKSHYIFTEY